MSENAAPIWGNELEYYINTGTNEAAAWTKVTELLTWEPSDEPKTYEPAWLDRKVSPVFVQGRTCSINWTKDTVKNGALEAWVMEHRNETDVACEVCRMFTWLGTAAAQTADMASFLFNPADPSNANGGQPVVTGGTLNMADDGWTEGTWNPSTKAFAAGSAPAQA